jgi:hypothetical protein
MAPCPCAGTRHMGTRARRCSPTTVDEDEAVEMRCIGEEDRWQIKLRGEWRRARKAWKRGGGGAGMTKGWGALS